MCLHSYISNCHSIILRLLQYKTGDDKLIFSIYGKITLQLQLQ